MEPADVLELARRHTHAGKRDAQSVPRAFQVGLLERPMGIERGDAVGRGVHAFALLAGERLGGDAGRHVSKLLDVDADAPRRDGHYGGGPGVRDVEMQLLGPDQARLAPLLVREA